MGAGFGWMILVFLLVCNACSVSCSSRKNLESESGVAVVLDVKAVLQSLSLHLQQEQGDEEEEQEQEEVMQIVHRSSLKKPSSRKSHQQALLDRLQRDEARVRSIGQRLDMALNGFKQSDLLHIHMNKSSTSSSWIKKRSFESEDRSSAAAAAGSPVTSGLSFGSGEYFVRMGIGSPPKSMYLVMDTGSDVPWIQCSPCKNCYKQYDSIFDPSQSTSFRKIPCSAQQCKLLDVRACGSSDNRCLYQVAYGDGSFTVGDLVFDSFSIQPRSSSSKSSSSNNSSVVFGCGHDNEGLFVGAAGLLGLGAGKLSFPSQMRSSSKKFSYCLVTRDNGNKASSALLFGESAIPDSASFAFTQLLKNPRLETFYYAGLSGMSIGGSLLEIPSATFKLSSTTGRGGVIIDSGTSVTRLPTTAYTIMRDAFRSGTAKLPRASSFSLFDTCYDFSALTSVTIPTVVLHFEGGASVQLPPGNYMVPVDTSGTFCFAFAKTSLDLSIIGNIQQQTMRVAIDLDASRVGFAPKQCT